MDGHGRDTRRGNILIEVDEGKASLHAVVKVLLCLY